MTSIEIGTRYQTPAGPVRVLRLERRATGIQPRQAVAGPVSRVNILSLTTGNRAWVNVEDFLATATRAPRRIA